MGQRNLLSQVDVVLIFFVRSHRAGDWKAACSQVSEEGLCSSRGWDYIHTCIKGLFIGCLIDEITHWSSLMTSPCVQWAISEDGLYCGQSEVPLTSDISLYEQNGGKIHDAVVSPSPFLLFELRLSGPGNQTDELKDLLNRHFTRRVTLHRFWEPQLQTHFAQDQTEVSLCNNCATNAVNSVIPGNHINAPRCYRPTLHHFPISLTCINPFCMYNILSACWCMYLQSIYLHILTEHFTPIAEMLRDCGGYVRPAELPSFISSSVLDVVCKAIKDVFFQYQSSPGPVLLPLRSDEHVFFIFNFFLRTAVSDRSEYSHLKILFICSMIFVWANNAHASHAAS